jgi:cytochrome c biogenesis protein CcmG/thiol:disulfide interchange protein DsbE
MMRYARYFPLLIALFLAIVIASGVFQPPPVAHVSPMVNRVLPEFTFPRIDNPQQRLQPQNWHGQVVLLNVFATWCEPCKAEHTLLMKLAQDRVVAIYGIAWRDTPEKIIHWLNEAGNPYQAVAQDASGKSTVMLGLAGIPETFVMDKRNIVKFKLDGPITEEIMQTKIIPLIEQLKREP